mmetsp:Transcript_6586/g.24446  ORF Transcript_6586/g.24446 Transcript_6586/m.24446 type:complete len:297 (-) Transcript_6586:49-939(-)
MLTKRDGGRPKERGGHFVDEGTLTPEQARVAEALHRILGTCLVYDTPNAADPVGVAEHVHSNCDASYKVFRKVSANSPVNLEEKNMAWKSAGARNAQGGGTQARMTKRTAEVRPAEARAAENGGPSRSESSDEELDDRFKAAAVDATSIETHARVSAERARRSFLQSSGTGENAVNDDTPTRKAVAGLSLAVVETSPLGQAVKEVCAKQRETDADGAGCDVTRKRKGRKKRGRTAGEEAGKGADGETAKAAKDRTEGKTAKRGKKAKASATRDKAKAKKGKRKKRPRQQAEEGGQD